MMIELSEKWNQELASYGETGMGYQIVSVILTDGTRYDQIGVIEGKITGMRGCKELPFTGDVIAQIIVTHDKWDFNAERQTYNCNQ